MRSFSAEQRVRNAFKVLDLDKSGLLSSAEVVDGLGSIGYHVSARDVEQWFATTDADESGEIPSSSCLVSSRLVSFRLVSSRLVSSRLVLFWGGSTRSRHARQRFRWSANPKDCERMT